MFTDSTHGTSYVRKNEIPTVRVVSLGRIYGRIRSEAAVGSIYGP